MRLDVQLLNTGATLNSFSVLPTIEIFQGETVDLFFRIVDKDQKGLRYIPASGATLNVEIARFPEVFGTLSNQREIKDFSIRRAAVNPFADDRSIWKLPIAASETANMASGNVRLTLTEGSKISIVVFSQAIKVNRAEGV